MTAYAPPPAILDGQLLRAGELSRSAAALHAAAVKSELDALEGLIAALPDGDAKSGLKHRALRLHNVLARGGRALNAHFQTPLVSPDSAGGDKDGDGQQS